MNADHFLLVAGLIRSNIDALDSFHASQLLDPKDETALSSSIKFVGFDISEYDRLQELGSPLLSSMFSEIEEDHKNNPAFHGFRIALGKFMTRFLPAYGIPLPQGKAVSFHESDKVLFKILKSDWSLINISLDN